METAGGKEAFDAAVTAMLDDARGWRLAEMRKRRGMTQEQVAVRMGVSVARVSQIERGDVSTQDVLNRYVAALGGTSSSSPTSATSNSRSPEPAGTVVSPARAAPVGGPRLGVLGLGRSLRHAVPSTAASFRYGPRSVASLCW